MFDSVETWNLLLQLFILASAVLAGNVIRRKVGLITRSLIPSALIGGLLVLVLKLFPWFQDIIDRQIMETVTYHMLALGFIAMSLRQPAVRPGEFSENRASTILDTGTLTVGTYLLQGVLGLMVTIPLFLLARASHDGMFYAGGLLLPMGFGQGPGQALNFGTIYEHVAAQQGIVFRGADFGLSIAAIGFIAGSVTGVWYMNRLRRKGCLVLAATASEVMSSVESDTSENDSSGTKEASLREEYSRRLLKYESEDDLPDSESIDKLTVIVCIVLAVYGVVYLFMRGVSSIDMGTFGEETVKPLIYGFNFLWGIFIGSFVRFFIQWLRKKGFMTRNYTNDYLLTRISGLCFDLMIVAGTAAISFESLKSFLLPLLLVAFIGTAGTFLYLKSMSKHLYKGYQLEGFFSMFGMLTGTVGNGMILLRELDPLFITPAADNLVMQSIPALFLGLPLLILMGYAPHSLGTLLVTFAVMLAAFLLITLYLSRKNTKEKK